MSSDENAFQAEVTPRFQCHGACAYCDLRPGSRGAGRQGVGFPGHCTRPASELVRGEQGRAPVVVISTVGGRDPYDPGESGCEDTRRRLEELRDIGGAVLVATHSDRVLRDLPLLAEIARRGSATVLVRVPTVDPEMAALWQPEAPPPARRLELLRPLAEAGIAAGLLASPLAPYLMDGHDQLRTLVRAAVGAGAQFFLTEAMALEPGPARDRVRQLFGERWPQLLGPFRELYGDAQFPPDAYSDRIAADARRLGIMMGLPYGLPTTWSPAELLHTAFAGRTGCFGVLRLAAAFDPIESGGEPSLPAGALSSPCAQLQVGTKAVASHRTPNLG